MKDPWLLALLALAFLSRKKGSSVSAGILDITEFSNQSRRQGKRDWKNITRVTLHQTDARIGEKPESWKNLKAHMGITQGGRIILVHPLDQLVYHGHGTNNSSVGIEIDGTFYGIEGDEKTFRRRVEWPIGSGKWYTRAPSTLSDAQRDAAREAVRYIMEEATRHGGAIMEVVAHRQASNQRRPDPGEAIWRNVGIYARDQLGLKTPVDKTWGTGLKIPKEWDPTATAPY